MKAIPSRHYSAKLAKTEEELSERYPYKHIFPSNFPQGFAIADCGDRRGTGITYFLPDQLGKKKRDLMLSALDVFFNGSCTVAHVPEIAEAIGEILSVSGLEPALGDYITEDVIFGKHRVSHKGKHLLDLCSPSEANFMVIKLGWVRTFPPANPLMSNHFSDIQHKVRRGKVFDPFDAFLWPIGGVYREKRENRSDHIVMNLSAAADVRRFGADLYRAISDT